MSAAEQDVRRSVTGEELVPIAPLLEAVDRWIAEGDGRNQVERDLGEVLARRIRDWRSGNASWATLPVADRLLCLVGRPYLLREIAPPPKTRGGYTWPNPHPLRKISQRQVEACWTLHQNGVSIRELGRHLWERLGYASPHACAAAISEAFKRDGLKARDRLEATRQANDRLGYVRGRTGSERRRQRRSRLRESSPEFRAWEKARLEALHSGGPMPPKPQGVPW